jgi:hypothetical protein
MWTVGWCLGGWLAACKREEPTTTEAADADADTDADTDTDTQVPPAPRTFLRLVHVGPALGPIDLWIDGEARPLAAAVSSPFGSSFNDAAPGRRTLVITAAGEPPSQAPLARLDLDLPDRARTTLVVHGAPDAVGFVAVPEVVSDLRPDAVRYTFFTAAAGTTAARVSLDGAETAAPYGERVLIGDAPAGARDVAVDLDGDGGAECTVTVQGVGEGAIAALYLAEDAGGRTIFGHEPSGRFAALPGPDPACDGPGGSGSGGAGGSGAATDDTAGATGGGSGASAAPTGTTADTGP